MYFEFIFKIVGVLGVGVSGIEVIGVVWRKMERLKVEIVFRRLFWLI